MNKFLDFKHNDCQKIGIKKMLSTHVLRHHHSIDWQFPPFQELLTHRSGWKFQSINVNHVQKRLGHRSMYDKFYVLVTSSSLNHIKFVYERCQLYQQYRDMRQRFCKICFFVAVKIIIDIIIMVVKRYYDDQTFLWPSYPFS